MNTNDAAVSFPDSATAIAGMYSSTDGYRNMIARNFKVTSMKKSKTPDQDRRENQVKRSTGTRKIWYSMVVRKKCSTWSRWQKRNPVDDADTFLLLLELRRARRA